MGQEIYMWLVSLLPSLASIIAVIAVAFKILSKFADLKKAVSYKNEYIEEKQARKRLEKEVADLITEMRKQKYDINMDKEI